MKTLLAIVLLVGAVATANQVKLTKKHTALYTLDQSAVVSAEVTNRAYKCPPNAMCIPTHVLALTFRLNGCLDKLATVSAVEVNGTYVVTANALSHKDNNRVRCFAPATETFNVYLGPGFKETAAVEVLVVESQTQNQ